MSWYGTLKTAVLVERNPDMSYMDIGHSKYDSRLTGQTPNNITSPIKEMLWVMTPDYDIHEANADDTVEETYDDEDSDDVLKNPRYVQHYDTFLSIMGTEDDLLGNPTYLAKGRYTKSKDGGTASLAMSWGVIKLETTNPRKYEFIVKHVIEALENYYGADTQIIPFR